MWPYKKFVALSVVFNVLSALLNIFSFAALIPILQILFKTGDHVEVKELMAWGSGSFKDVAINNIYYYINQFIGEMGSTTTLLFIGLFLIFATLLKTAAYFLASAVVVPIRTGVVRDIRNQLYHKITTLPLGFFSDERKGDIIARMTGDVQEVETSIMSSLDLMFKNPILIISYFTTLVVISWELTLFSVVIIPIIGWFMVKEKHVVEQDEEDKVRFSDFFTLLKENDAILVDFFKCVFTGFIWTFLFAAPVYYVKYAYCTDLTTGVFDTAKYGTYSMIVSLMMLFPLLIGTMVATPILKAFKGDFVKMQKFDYLMQGVGGLVLFVGQILGILQKVPAIFFAGMFIMAMFIGIDFVPGSSIGMEIMDYTIYKTGKDRSALTGVLSKFLEKAQSAVSSALVGGILIAIGYQVDSVTLTISVIWQRCRRF